MPEEMGIFGRAGLKPYQSVAFTRNAQWGNPVSLMIMIVDMVRLLPHRAGNNDKQRASTFEAPLLRTVIPILQSD